MVIPLGRPFPDGSSDLLGTESARAPPAGNPAVPVWSCTGWGLPCPPRHRGGGALLPHHFTLAGVSAGGLLSVALSFESPRLAVSQHLALGARTFLAARPFRGDQRDHPPRSGGTAEYRSRARARNRGNGNRQDAKAGVGGAAPRFLAARRAEGGAGRSSDSARRAGHLGTPSASARLGQALPDLPRRLRTMPRSGWAGRAARAAEKATPESHHTPMNIAHLHVPLGGLARRGTLEPLPPPPALASWRFPTAPRRS
jgi:hypothetical protein